MPMSCCGVEHPAITRGAGCRRGTLPRLHQPRFRDGQSRCGLDVISTQFGYDLNAISSSH
eukprot:590488-Pleurochrysis_carterae.AAC.1